MPPPLIRVPVMALPRPVARMARALLDDAAAQGGGSRRATADAEELEGCAPGPAHRAATAIAELLAAAGGVRAGTALLPPEGAAAREAWAAALPLGQLAALSVFTRGDAPAMQRLAPARLAEPALRDALCRRLLAALASATDLAALPRLRPGLRLMLDFPEAGLARGARSGGAAGAVALLPLAAAAQPHHLADTLARLRAAGWSAALRLPGPAALRLVELARLPPLDLLVLEDPGEALPDDFAPPTPLALAGRVGPALRARAAEQRWFVEAAR